MKLFRPYANSHKVGFIEEDAESGCFRSPVFIGRERLRRIHGTFINPNALSPLHHPRGLREDQEMGVASSKVQCSGRSRQSASSRTHLPRPAPYDRPIMPCRLQLEQQGKIYRKYLKGLRPLKSAAQSDLRAPLPRSAAPAQRPRLSRAVRHSRSQSRTKTESAV